MKKNNPDKNTSQPDRLDLASISIIDNRLARLCRDFPEVFREGKVDFDSLRRSLGDWVDPGKERFGLTWPGKAECIKIIQQPSVGTLLPMPGESVAPAGTPVKKKNTGHDLGGSQNLIIEGENLEVLKLLQKSYYGKVKMIYIDPPYNTGNEFIYPDNYREGLQDYLKYSGQVDGEGVKLSTNTESDGRYHSKWLNMMYPRLFLARNLLDEDGAIFISIDDNEVSNLRKLCNEVFGEENFVAQLIWKNGRTAAAHFTNEHEYIVCFAKAKDKYPLFSYEGKENITERAIKRPSGKNPISQIKFPAGMDFESDDKIFPKEFGEGEPIKVIQGIFQASDGKLTNDVILAAAWTMKDMIEAWIEGETVIDQKGQKVVRFFFKSNGVLQYEKEKGTIHPKSIIDGITTKTGSNELMAIFGKNVFEFPKPSELVRKITHISSKDSGIILDFFAGSGTTAHAVMKLNAEDGGNRRFILVQLPEPAEDEYPTISAITRERIRRAAKAIAQEREGKLDLDGHGPLDLGFRAYKLTTSNFKPWVGDPAQVRSVTEQLNAFADNVLDGRNENDILAEIMLKSGKDLSMPVEKLSLARKTVYSVAEGTLLVCLDRALTLEVIEAMVERNPEQIVCLEAGFMHNDQLKVNAVQTIKTRERSKETTIAFKVV